MRLEKVTTFPPIVCPIDKLRLRELEVALVCERGHQYEVREGIPRLMAPEDNYAEAFGAQWNHYRLTQLDSYTKTSLSRDRLERCLGADLWHQLQQRDRLEVLETGCGAGRFTEVLLQLPAASVTSTDLSSAVDANQLNCPQSDRHRVFQCDINRLPFLPGQYDIVVCLGVVQHTKDTEQTIADLYQQVKPGGWLVIDHYTHTLSVYTKLTAALLRPVLKRLPPWQGVKATRFLTRMFFPLHRAVRSTKLLQMILSRFSPILTYYHALPELNDALQYEWSELDTHDFLTDHYRHLRSPRAIRSALENLKAKNIWVAKGGNGVEARCQRPH